MVLPLAVSEPVLKSPVPSVETITLEVLLVLPNVSGTLSTAADALTFIRSISELSSALTLMLPFVAVILLPARLIDVLPDVLRLL